MIAKSVDLRDSWAICGETASQMLKINHPKVASLAPTWAPFGGCSVIFDEFGDSACGKAVNEDTGAYAASELYDTLTQCVAKAQGLRQHGFCPLPPASYHCTVADLVNSGNVARVRSDLLQPYISERGRVIDPLGLASALCDLVDESGLVSPSFDLIEFAVERVVDRGGRVVVVDLSPAGDSTSQRAYRQLVDARGRLNAIVERMLGISLPKFEPHVSLGYFADRERAPAAYDLVVDLEECVLAANGDRTYGFGRPALYSFSDMATYSRVGRSS